MMSNFELNIRNSESEDILNRKIKFWNLANKMLKLKFESLNVQKLIYISYLISETTVVRMLHNSHELYGIIP